MIDPTKLQETLEVTERREETRLPRLYYLPDSKALMFRSPDSAIWEKALELNQKDVKTSNYSVVFAAKILFLRGEIPAFSLIIDKVEYPINEYGMFENEPENIFQQMIELLNE